MKNIDVLKLPKLDENLPINVKVIVQRARVDTIINLLKSERAILDYLEETRLNDGGVDWL